MASLEPHQNLNVKSEHKLHSFLLNQVNNKEFSNEIKGKLDKLNETTKKNSDANMIFKFKLEKTQGDSLFSTLNELPKSKVGAGELSIYARMDKINRYNLSKTLISEAEVLERTWIVNVTDRLLRKLNRYKYNYLFKGILFTGFLHYAIKGRAFFHETGIKKDSTKTLQYSIENFQKSIVYFFMFGLSSVFL